MKKIIKYLTLFLIGGVFYYSLEVIFRGYSFPAMAVCGGLCFIICGVINERSRCMPLVLQQLIAASGITVIEFISGLILNVWLGLNMWDYLRSKLSGDLDKETSQCMNPVRYVLGMEDAIRRDDLVVMRRCQGPEYYVKYLRESRKKLDKILGSPILEPKLREGQLTIWDFIGGQ